MDKATLLLIAEGLLAGALLVFIVWWTMRDRQEHPLDDEEER